MAAGSGRWVACRDFKSLEHEAGRAVENGVGAARVAARVCGAGLRRGFAGSVFGSMKCSEGRCFYRCAQGWLVAWLAACSGALRRGGVARPRGARAEGMRERRVLRGGGGESR